MLQGWYWDYPKTIQNHLWVDTLALQAKYMGKHGIDYIWLPPLSMGGGGKYSNGYDIKDLFDIGKSKPLATGFGYKSKIYSLIDSLETYNIIPVADMIYNHRDNGRADINPAVEGWIENYSFQDHVNGDQAYPSDRFRCILPIGVGTNLGAGTYYIKIKSASGHPDFYGKAYEFRCYTKKSGTSFPSNTIDENEASGNGGGDCSQGNINIQLNKRYSATLDNGGCGIDEYELTLTTANFFTADTIYIQLYNTDGTYSDQFISGVYYTGTGTDVQSQVRYQTFTNHFNSPSGRGGMNYTFFKPNGNPTCLCGDLDYMWFYYDYDHAVPATRDTLFEWTNWMWDTVGVRGLRLDALKHMTGSFLGDLLDNMHYSNRNPPMVVGESYDYDALTLKNRVDEVYNYMDQATKDAIVFRIFDFNLQAALRDACDAFGYDARNIFNAGIVENQGMDRLNAVIFVNNHDFREAYNRVDNDPILGYAYILTNPTVGTPCIYYTDYLSGPNPSYKSKMNGLMSTYHKFIQDAGYKEYLNKFGSVFNGFYTSGTASNSLIYQLGGITNGCGDNQDVVVAINFSGDPLKVYQKLNMDNAYNFNVGDTLFDVIGNASNDFEIINSNQELYIDIPARSYAVYVLTHSPDQTNITASGSTSVCQGENVLLSANSVNDCYTYQWQKNNIDIIDADQPTYAVNSSGTYRLVVSLGGQMEKYSNTITVTVSPDFPLVLINEDTLSTTASGNLQWYYGTDADSLEIIPGATSQQYISTTNGYYSLVVTDINGCIASSEVELIATGYDNLLSGKNFSVYPNPFIENIEFKTTNIDLSSSSIQIIDSKGRLVLSLPYQKELNLKELSAGVYTINIITDKETIKTKIVKIN
jgi:hypothetical protein